MPKKAFRFVLVAAVMAVSCGDDPVPPARQPAGILYVAAPELAIHEQPSESSPVAATFREGESVSMYATRGNWIEVHLYDDRTGWARKDQLTSTPPGFAGGSSGPRFRRAPSPVWTQKKVRGEIVFEATVDVDGNVLSVRTVENSTGEPGLEAQNRAQIAAAKFHPLIRGGRPVPFLYTYRVTY